MSGVRGMHGVDKAGPFIADGRTPQSVKRVAADLHKLGLLADPSTVLEYDIEITARQVRVKSRVMARLDGEAAVKAIRELLLEAELGERVGGDRKDQSGRREW